MSKYAIEIKDLVKTFDSFKLGPVNLTIPKGTIVGYIGQNGAGKSTTIKLLLGLLRKDSGDIRLLDEENPNSVELKDKLGPLTQKYYLLRKNVHSYYNSNEDLCGNFFSNRFLTNGFACI